jgi:hypothetical protein
MSYNPEFLCPACKLWTDVEDRGEDDDRCHACIELANERQAAQAAAQIAVQESGDEDDETSDVILAQLDTWWRSMTGGQP